MKDKLTASLARQAPLLATVAVFVLLYGLCSLRYTGFSSWFQFSALLSDNATLGLVAVGMTFVILSGGIDLSVGAVVALSSMVFALLLSRFSLHWSLALPCVLLIGSAFGAGMGAVIVAFRLPPFLVTLAGMFLARGLALVLTAERRLSVTDNAAYRVLGRFDCFEITVPAFAFLVVVLLAIVLARSTRFGRSV